MRNRLFGFVSATAAIAAVIGLILASRFLLPPDVHRLPGGPAASTTQEVSGSQEDEGARVPLDTPEEAPASSEPLFQWPTSRREISGWRFHDPRKPDHPGIDIAAEAGDPVSSVADGKVSEAGWRDDGRGYTVVVEHADGWSSTYAQLEEIAVDVGQTVSQGKTVGRAGSRGESSGPHLHLELHSYRRVVNPLDYLPPMPDSTPNAPQLLVFADEIGVHDATVDRATGQLQPSLLQGSLLSDPHPSDPSVLGRLAVGAESHFSLHWQVTSAPSVDWRVFAPLVREETGDLATQSDADVDWPDDACGEGDSGEACGALSQQLWRVPADLPPGVYGIEVGLYDPQTGEQAPVTRPRDMAGETSVVLRRVRIVSEDDASTARGGGSGHGGGERARKTLRRRFQRGVRLGGLGGGEPGDLRVGDLSIAGQNRPFEITVEGTDVIWHFNDLEPQPSEEIRLFEPSTGTDNMVCPMMELSAWAEIEAARSAVDVEPDSVEAHLRLAEALEAGTQRVKFFLATATNAALIARTDEVYQNALELASEDVDGLVTYLEWLSLPRIQEEGGLAVGERYGAVLSRALELAPDDPRLVRTEKRVEEWRQAISGSTSAEPTPSPTPSHTTSLMPTAKPSPTTTPTSPPSPTATPTPTASPVPTSTLVPILPASGGTCLGALALPGLLVALWVLRK